MEVYCGVCCHEFIFEGDTCPKCESNYLIPFSPETVEG